MAAPSRDNPKEVCVDFGSMPQENVSFQQLFDEALSAQQQKKSDEALKLYQEALDKGQSELNSAQASVIYHNLSTLAYEKSDFLHAYIWSKKALSLNPGNHLAQQSFEQYSKKFEVPKVAHQMTTSHNIQKILKPLPVDFWFVLSLIALFVSLRLFFIYLLQKRKNQIELVSVNSFAWKPLVSFFCLLLILTGTFLRWQSEQTLNAIITAENTGVQTAAGENKPVIFEAQPGTEVEVLQLTQDYVQVRYPGAFSGWVLKKNLEVLSKQLEIK